MENSSRIIYDQTSHLKQALSTSVIIASLLVIVFGVMSILDLWNPAITMTEVSFALLMLIRAIEYKEKSKKKMVCCLAAGIAVLLFWICVVL